MIKDVFRIKKFFSKGSFRHEQGSFETFAEEIALIVQKS